MRWKTCSCSTFGWISGTNWIADAPVPITATRSPASSCSWSQRAEWKVVPSKLSRPGSVGIARVAQRPLGGDHDVGGQLALRGLDPPQLRVVVPVGGDQLAVEADVRHHAVALGAVAQVVEDLGLRRERARPVRVRGERERVEVRGHVAAAAGIGVVAPGAADVRGALEHGEVELALLPQLDCHPEPREAGADDDDPMVGHVNLRSPGSRSSTVQSASRSIGTSGCSHIQWATPS